MSIQELEVAFRGAFNPQPLLGKLGYVVGGVASVQTSDPALYNVRLDDGRFITAYHNNAVAPDFDRSVKLTTEVRDGKQVFVILGVAGGADGGNPGISAHSHSRASGMYFEIDTWLVSGFRVTPGQTALTVQIGPGFYWFGGARYWFTGTVIDISAEVPGTANQHGWTTLSFDPSDTTFTLTSSTPQSVALQLLEGNIPAAPAGTKDVAALKLVNGMTELIDSSIVDTRFILWRESSETTTSGIVIYHADGSAPELFDSDSVGLDSASAAATTGDIVLLPAGTITGNHTLTSGVEYVGEGREATILTGQITVDDGTTVRDLSVIRSASSSSALIGVLMDTDAATARLYACTVTVTNSGSGDAYAVQGGDGTTELHECVVSATATPGDGYGTYATAGAVKMYGGTRSGSTADGQVGSVTPTIPPGGDPAYFANNGTNQAVFPNIISPSAYTYNGVTYVAYLGASFGTYVDAYDHATRTWAGAELVRSNPGSFDDHSTPSVIVDDSGYIHVFFGGNASAGIVMRHTRSSNPENITVWTNQTDIGANTTYHSAVKLADGTIYVFYTKSSGGLLQTYYVRSDESYGTEHQAHVSGASGASIYFGNPVYDEDRNRIWFMWCYYEPAPTSKRRYMFVSYLNLSDGHWYGGMDDADLGTTTDTTDWVTSCQLLSSSYETNHPNLFLDGYGNLHIEYNVKDSGVWKHAYRKWDGSSWGSIELITTANHQFNMGDIYVNTDGTVDAYLVTNASAARGGNLEHWQRSVGGSWSLVRTIFDKATYATHDGAMFPTVNRSDPSGVIRVVFADDENTPTSNDLRIYAVDVNDAYVIDNPGAGIFLNAVATTPTDSDTALAGDRAAWDTVNYPDLHRADGDNLHLPTPSAAGQVAVSVSDGAGSYVWELATALTAVTVQEDAATEGTVTTLNFTGSAVNVSVAGSTATLTIAPTTRWEPLVYDGAIVFGDGDVVMVEVEI